MLNNWTRRATCEADRIRELWSENPNANVGGATGVAAGRWVLDVDPPLGIEALEQLEQEHGPLPATLTVHTPRGGRHLYFLTPNDGRVVTNANPIRGYRGLDVRGEGGQALLPPSPGYTTDPEHTHPVAAPAWLLDIVAPLDSGPPSPDPSAERSSRRANASPSDEGPGSPLARGRGILEAACKRIQASGPGQRHETIRDTAFGIGGYLAASGLPREEARSRLVSAGRSVYASNELRGAKVEAAVDSGLDRGAAKPLALPPDTWTDRPRSTRSTSSSSSTFRDAAPRTTPLQADEEAVARGLAGLERLERAIGASQDADERAELFASFVRDGSAIDDLARARLARRVDTDRALAAVRARLPTRQGDQLASVVGRQAREIDMARKGIRLVGPDDTTEGPRDSNRRRIVLGNRADLNEADALDALLTVPGIYSRTTQLVRIEGAKLVHLTADGLIPLLSQAADFYTTRETSDGGILQVPTSPPTQLARSLVAKGTYGTMPRFDGFTRAPVLHRDGTVNLEPGYDPTSCMVYTPTGEPPTLLESPTRASARAALGALVELVAQVPFSTEADTSAWLALVLTHVGRTAYNGPAPLFAGTANQARVGKTRSIQFAGLIAHGVKTPTTTYPTTATELNKTIDAYVFAGTDAVLFDNVRGPIGGPSLEQVLTTTSYSGRILGKSERCVVDNVRTVWAVSANGATFSGDTAARTLPICLRYDGSRPEDRNFGVKDWEATALERRGELLGCALDVLRAYIFAGRPAMNLKPWGSFEAWSALVRGAIVWAGLPDPIGARANIDASDLAANEHEQLVALAAELFGRSEWTVARLAARIDEGRVGERWSVDEARGTLEELNCWNHGSRRVNCKALGKRLNGYAGRPTSDGLQITSAGSDPHTKRRRWRVA